MFVVIVTTKEHAVCDALNGIAGRGKDHCENQNGHDGKVRCAQVKFGRNVVTDKIHQRVINCDNDAGQDRVDKAAADDDIELYNAMLENRITERHGDKGKANELPAMALPPRVAP